MEENTQDLSENLAQDSSDLGEDSRESHESNNDSSQKALEKYLRNNKIPKNSEGQFLPNNKQLKKLVGFEDIKLSQIDTSNVTNMKELFKYSKRADFSGIEDWNVSKVTTFFECFYYCKTFNGDLSKWKTSSATNFMRMFCGAENFDCDLSDWDTRLVTNMIDMFRSARAFNGNISGWNTDSLEFMWWMFWGAENFNQPLNDWDVSRVKNMNNLFMSAKNFNQPLDKWNVQNVESMEKIFNGAESFNQDLSAWGDKIAKVQNLRYAFAKTKSLERDFRDSWDIADTCDTENIIKGSKLESTQAKSTKTAHKLDNFTISEIDKKDFEKIKIDSAKAENKDGFLEWMPNVILENYHIFLAKEIQDGDSDKTIKVKGNEKEWDIAIVELFDFYFLIEKKKQNENNEDESSPQSDSQDKITRKNTFEIVQKKKCKEDELRNRFLGTFEISNLTFYFGNNCIWIQNTQGIKKDNLIANIAKVIVIANAYNAKIQTLIDKARQSEQDDKKSKIPIKESERVTALRQFHAEICKFDLHSYLNIPIQNNIVLLEIWRHISNFYRVRENHDELKETIAQIAQLTNDESKEKRSIWFSVVAIFIALASLVVSSVSLVK